MNLLGDSQASALSLVQNPFKNDKINRIDMQFSKVLNRWSGTISFRNGMTGGSQNFEVPEATGLPILLQQMQDFVNSL
jgi:hypothetical protein